MSGSIADAMKPLCLMFWARKGSVVGGIPLCHSKASGRAIVSMKTLHLTFRAREGSLVPSVTQNVSSRVAVALKTLHLTMFQVREGSVVGGLLRHSKCEWRV